MTDSIKMSQKLIRLYQEEIDRFDRIKDESDFSTSRELLIALMDFYENPKTVTKDDPEHLTKIEELQKEVDRLSQENGGLSVRLQETEGERDRFRNEANDNARRADALQLELDALKSKRLDENQFVCTVHPVAWKFLKEMCERMSKEKGETVAPDFVLTDLFIQDLQNPRANNLPYIVETSRIRKALDEYRKERGDE